jgi:isoquinoline 1-oxidoreductase
MPELIRLTVNGAHHDVPAQPERTLLVALREDLGLTGAKYGCAAGACGACTVLVDGSAVRACVTPAADAAGRVVTTAEGLATDTRLHPVQAALVDGRAAQCGYCMPGMAVAAAALLRTHPDPTGAQIVAALDGNICRCGSYPRILRALRRAAQSPAQALAVTPDADEPPGAADVTQTDPGWACSQAGGALPGAAGWHRRADATPWDLRPAADRDYFDVLGDGLVSITPPEVGPAGRPSPWPTNGGAWIHVGTADDGGADNRATSGATVTAFTGKVDVGQDNTTALAMLVAEELRVPLASVRMVMGDTDICPYDIGTFASRSMPDAGQALQVAAAAARQALVDLAATAMEVAPGGLSAGDAAVKDLSSGTEVSYGDLVSGLRRTVTATPDAPVTQRRGWHTAGQPAHRRDATAAVTGAKRFTSDLTLPGMLHGRVLRPPGYGARLRAVDLRRALELPGVVAVHDGSFAGVAAPDPVTAAHALALVDAEWERAPQPAQRDLAGYLRTHPLEIPGWGGSFRHETGDVTAAIKVADVQVAATYSTAYIAHVPLEPRAALAHWHDGRLTVWTGTQRPFGVRQELADTFGVSEAGVRVVVAGTGSGFGGKHAGVVAAEAARLARAAGLPVKVQWSREEEFTCGYFRPAAIIDVHSGTSSDGTLTAWQFTNVNSGAAAILSPYLVPNEQIQFQPAQSPLPQGSYRALAATANNFARESHLDEVADLLGIDPLEFRLRHLRDDRLAAVLRTCAERAGWPAAGPARTVQASVDPGVDPGGRAGAGAGRHGLGIACGMEKDARVATCAEVTVRADGELQIDRIVTAYECGTAVNPDNVISQIEGATVMALGGALFEAVEFDDGVIRNASLARYRVPRFADVPAIEVVLMDKRDIPPGGAGETPMIAVAPALANAIFAATGHRIRGMPLLPSGTLPR